MSAITTIQGTDLITNSRTVINANFAALNADKIETSVIDTDTTLAANSDSKLPSQKAVKAYVDASVNPTGRSWNEYAASATGTDSYAITVSGISSYTTGQTYKFKADVANTGSASLNVNGLGAKTIKKDVTSDLVTGDILANQIVLVTYDGTNMQLSSETAGTSTNTIANTSSINTLNQVVRKLVGVANSSNTTWENYQLPFGTATGSGGNNWTQYGSPTFVTEKITFGGAVGVYKNVYDMLTATQMTFANQKTKIIEFDALIQADASTGSSFMGFTDAGNSASAWVDANIATIVGLGFRTNDSGDWRCISTTGSTITQTTFTNPTAGKHTFRIEYNPATPNALFYVDGVLVVTLTTTMPTTGNMNIAIGNGTSSVIIRAVNAPMFAIEK
jgi:hypothetical protein